MSDMAWLDDYRRDLTEKERLAEMVQTPKVSDNLGDVAEQKPCEVPAASPSFPGLMFDDAFQKKMHDLRVWYKYSAKTKVMLGAPQPAEYDEFNKKLWEKAHKEMDAFVPGVTKCN
jgi:hypothetical protein